MDSSHPTPLEDSQPVMWYGECPPVGASTRLITSPKPVHELHYYPGWRQCQYLPLSRGSEYASGLTAYMSPQSGDIYGLVAHIDGSSDSVFGQAGYETDEQGNNNSYCGTPIHFALHQGEYLTSAWSFMRRLVVSLLAQTWINSHRCC